MKQAHYIKLQRLNTLLSEAMGVLNHLQSEVGYLTSLRDLKRLIKAKLILETILDSSSKQLKIHSPEPPKDTSVSKEKLDTILLALLGKDYLVKAWWSSPNRAFSNNTPEQEYIINQKAVVTYLLQQINGDYS